MSEQLNLKATATLKLLKYDDQGNLVAVEENTIELTKEEAQTLWLSQQKA